MCLLFFSKKRFRDKLFYFKRLLSCLENSEDYSILQAFIYQLYADKVLTHLSLVSLLWNIGKQNSPRCDAAERGVPSGAILFD